MRKEVAGASPPKPTKAAADRAERFPARGDDLCRTLGGGATDDRPLWRRHLVNLSTARSVNRLREVAPARPAQQWGGPAEAVQAMLEQPAPGGHPHS